MNEMWKKLTVGCAVALCTAFPLFAGPGGHHHRGGDSGVRLAAEIVGLVKYAVAPIGLIAVPPPAVPVVTAPVVTVPPVPRMVVLPPPPPVPCCAEPFRHGFAPPPPPHRGWEGGRWHGGGPRGHGGHGRRR